MAEFPYFPLYPGDYLADTQHLTTVEHGAYLLLLLTMWRSPDCRLPNDEARLARYCKMRPSHFRKVWPSIQDLFTVEGDKITQKRLQEEYRKACSKRTSARTAGSLGGISRAAKSLKDNKAGQADAKRTLSQPEPELYTPLNPPTGEGPDGDRGEGKTDLFENPPAASRKGARLPEGWKPNTALIAYAEKELGLSRSFLARETEAFRDYWRAAPGQKGVKLDWDATWRNWMRRTAERAKPQYPPRGNPEVTSRLLNS